MTTNGCEAFHSMLGTRSVALMFLFFDVLKGIQIMTYIGINTKAIRKLNIIISLRLGTQNFLWVKT